MKQALLVIDVQNDYFAGGKMALANPVAALHIIKTLEKTFAEKSLPILYIQHIKDSQNADFFARDTAGAELHPDLTINTDTIIIEKHFPNSFLDTNLQQTLQQLQVEQLVITGMMTHMCVDSTTRASTELGYQPIVITDATATKDLTFNDKNVPAEEVSAAFLAALTTFARVISAEEFLVN